MGKLVRDRVPEIIAADGRQPRVRVLEDDEYLAALLHKLVEEVDELRDANPRERLAEAADVYEVLLALISLSGHDQADLESAAEEKRQARGAFLERWWWEED